MTTSSNTIKGYEILEFEDAEMIKSEDSSRSLAKGSLKVVFFPDIHCFMLMLNDIYYPLLHNLSIPSFGELETKSRTYFLPTKRDYYVLKLNKIPNLEAVQNFETILSHFCKLFHGGQPNPAQEAEMTPTNLDTEISENKLVEDTENKHLEDPKIKKSMFAKAAHTISRVFGGSNKNLNMTTVKTIDQLMDISQDFLTMCEFPIETIKNSINNNMITADTTQNPVKCSLTRSLIQKFTVTYPKEIIDKEEVLIQEIKKHRELQDIEREKQQRHREKEIISINKERALQDEFNQLRCEKMEIEIAQREQMYGKALAEQEITMNQQEEQFSREVQNFIMREKTLRSEIESRIVELREKEELTQEEEAEFTRREQELVDLNKKLERERVEMEERHEALKKVVQTKEAEIQEKEKLIGAEKDEFKKKKEELQELSKQRLMELKNKEQMTEDERAEFKRKQKELDNMAKLTEKEKANLKSKQKEMQAQSEHELLELRKKEKLTESEHAELMRKQKELDTEVHQRLDEMNREKKSVEAESKDLQKKQKELSKMAKKTEAEQINLKNKEQKFVETMNKKEAALREKEKMTESERADLKSIKEKLKKETKLTEAERKDLESMRNKIVKEVEQREAEVMRREKLTEDERKEVERKEKETEKMLQTRLAELRQKEMLNEEEMTEMKHREEELVKITKMREAELWHSKQKLNEMSEHAHKLLVQNEKMVEGHIRIEQDVAELQQELNKPVIIKDQIETTKITSRSGERVVRETRDSKEAKSGEQIIGAQETTTSG